MSTKGKLPADLHRDTLQAALRVIGRAEDLDQARMFLARMLNGFDKARKAGLTADMALDQAEARVGTAPRPKPNPADLVPIRQREANAS